MPNLPQTRERTMGTRVQRTVVTRYGTSCKQRPLFPLRWPLPKLGNFVVSPRVKNIPREKHFFFDHLPRETPLHDYLSGSRLFRRHFGRAITGQRYFDLPRATPLPFYRSGRPVFESYPIDIDVCRCSSQGEFTTSTFRTGPNLLKLPSLSRSSK